MTRLAEQALKLIGLDTLNDTDIFLSDTSHKWNKGWNDLLALTHLDSSNLKKNRMLGLCLHSCDQAFAEGNWAKFEHTLLHAQHVMNESRR